jgi:signal transduction histidine kinase
VDLLIESVIESEFSNQSISLDLEHVTADVDPVRIKLLVSNLLQNAIKYNLNENSSPKLSLRKKQHRFIIEVRDYGAGISPEHIPFLTEPFYRADPSRRRMTGGYGLGLYLCRMIVEAHSGHIKIESGPGKGTLIRCNFPLAVDVRSK